MAHSVNCCDAPQKPQFGGKRTCHARSSGAAIPIFKFAAHFEADHKIFERQGTPGAIPSSSAPKRPSRPAAARGSATSSLHEQSWSRTESPNVGLNVG